jgi:hypothetical protein
MEDMIDFGEYLSDLICEHDTNPVFYLHDWLKKRVKRKANND